MTTSALSERYSSLTFDELPHFVVQRAKEFIIDTLGVAIGGSALPSATIASQWVSELGGRAESSIIAGPRVPAIHAALVNSTLAHGLELDDVDNASSSHPGAVVIPAALAVAEATRASGAEVLTAIVAGYDAMLRIGRAAGAPQLYARGFHPTATCGAFAAAVAASRLLALDPEGTANAVGIAGSFSAGNLEYMSNGAWTKRLQVGGAAQAGVLAASLAERGYSGPVTILEGPYGFLRQHSDAPHPDELTAGLSEPWGILEVSIKPFACCRYSQTPVDGVLELVQKFDIDADEVERVDVAIVSPGVPIVAEPRDQKLNPKNSVDAQFSLNYAVAVALRHRAAFSEEFSEKLIADPLVRDLLPRVHVRGDEELDAFYPQRWPARIRICLKDGSVHDAFLKSCRGDPDKPLSAEELVVKFEELSAGHLDEPFRSEIVRNVRELERAPSVADLMACLRKVVA